MLTIIFLTAFYSFLLIAPSIINPYSASAKYLQFISIFFTFILPILWCICTLIFVIPSNKNSEYWGSESWHGINGNHDFCEPNYAFYSHIVEFHNTWSSLLIISYGSIGTYYVRKYATLEARFPCAFISIGGVGIGSTLFHGTLRSWGQILDEVPMLFIIFACAYCHIESNALPKFYPYLPIALIVSCLIFVCGYLFFYFYAFFLIGFVFGVCVLLVYGAAIYSKISSLSQYLYLYAFYSLFVGVLFWCIDDVFCDREYVQCLNLHIGWHIFTGLSGYLFALYHVTLRAQPLKKEAVVCIPYIVYDHNYGGYNLVGMEIKTKKNNKDLIWIQIESPPEFILPYVALR